MAHKIAKSFLGHAGTFADRVKAVEAALSMGMPLNEVEDYLDWLDMVKPNPPKPDAGNGEYPSPIEQQPKAS